MIEINLLPGAKRKRGGRGAGFKLPDVSQLLASIKEPWLIAAVAAWLLVLGLGVPTYVRRAHAIRDLQPQLDKAVRDSVQLASNIIRKKKLEQRRDSLLVEIQVIRDIDRDRYVWPHLIDAITRALPDYTWLDDVAARAGEGDSTGAAAFSITGKTASDQAVTRFMRNLEESPFVEGVQLVTTATVTEQGRDVTSFVINAHYQQPSPSVLTMEPLEASVVQGIRSGGGARR
jgi:type IV pilus assembly protein PilN